MRGAAIAIAVVLTAGTAAADGGAPCVAIEGGALDARVRGKIATQLSAALGQHRIATCAAGEEPIARVTFEGAGGGEVAIRIHVEDAVTRKELARTVRVGAIPADGRPLALAVAADELLRASWAEIALTRAPEPPAAAPEAVKAVVRDSLPASANENGNANASANANANASANANANASASANASAMRAISLGALLSAEHAFGGLSQLGFDVRAGAWLVPRLGLALRLGARASPSSDAPDGQADATALLVGGGLAIALLPRDGAVTLDVPLRVDVERLQITGHAAPGARAASGTAFGSFASTGLDVGVRVSPALALELEATVGTPLRAVEATDASLAFTSLSSAIVGLAIGARVSP